MGSKVYLVLAICATASTTNAGYVQSSGDYFVHGGNHIYQQGHPSLNGPALIGSHYAPGTLQLRPPQQVTAVSRPQFVSVQAQRPLESGAFSRPDLAAQPLPPNVVAIQAQRPLQFAVPVAQSYPLQQAYAVPSYSYAYSVKDEKTGDEKSHQETRNGDDVVGKYTVVEPDGTLRTVTYTAGKNGFNAVVERTPGYAPPNAPGSIKVVTKPVVVPSSGYPFAGAFAVPASANYPPGFHFGG